MSPKKWQDSVDKMALHFGVPKEFAEVLVTAYWKQARKEVAEINKPRIELYGLGSFDLKYFKVKYKLRDVRAFIQYHEKSNTPRARAILQTLYRKLALLERVNSVAEDIARNIVKKRNDRKKYISENSVSLEKSTQYIGGSLEHNVPKPFCKEDS